MREYSAINEINRKCKSLYDMQIDINAMQICITEVYPALTDYACKIKSIVEKGIYCYSYH